jgi:hypothetical protein
MNFLNKVLADNNGNASSKRVVTLLAFLLCAVAFLTELFTGQHVSEHTLESMMYIVVAGLGFTASEKFTKKDEK